ncbi:uncharacterized protein B0T23DRAFT_10576 [Neurospora hispaniola]|uniref:Uncharacterized protein n=1 Tax=Neurospora hispaniola TaxID=588809 RepID=A0AAJ0MUZ1_9PEZI|nr:hypothetical protein B0T23DRAFT_10576 [Neurospora hispaniola]
MRRRRMQEYKMAQQFTQPADKVCTIKVIYCTRIRYQLGYNAGPYSVIHTQQHVVCPLRSVFPCHGSFPSLLEE